MKTLFDQEGVWEIERYNSWQEGREEGRQDEFEKTVRNMRKADLNDEKIAQLIGREVSEVQAVK